MKILLLTNSVTKEKQLINFDDLDAVSRITEASDKDEAEWGGLDWTCIDFSDGSYFSVLETPVQIYEMLMAL